MKSTFVALTLLGLSCAPARNPGVPASQPATAPAGEPFSIQSLHVRLAVNPATGDVVYFGWYDGRRNLLGPGGISTAVVGIAPPELKGELKKPSASELVFRGIDQNQVAWTKRYRLIDDHTVAVSHRVENRGDRAFDAIVYSLADLPDATITGDNRDQYIRTPVAEAHFRARIDNPQFPGEQMNPSALRSESKHLEPGDTLEFEMTWELQPSRRAR